MKESEDKWMQGFACACAITMENHDCETIVRNTYECNFMTICELKKAGVDEHDIKILKPIIKEIKRLRKG